MAKALGQPVDQELIESIEREERLSEMFFGKKKPIIVEEVKKPEPPSVLIQEADPAPPLPPPAPPAVVIPPKEELVKQVANVLNTANANNSVYRDKELEGMRRTIAEMIQKISTLSWGGGGTGIVRLFDADDFDRATVGEGKYMKFSNGWFVLDDINPSEITYNTTLVTGNTYTIQNSDYYIGANNQTESVTIILPAEPPAGKMVIIKDESGRAQINPIKINGNIDNDPGGAEIRINNGGVQLIYRNGWRIV